MAQENDSETTLSTDTQSDGENHEEKYASSTVAEEEEEEDAKQYSPSGSEQLQVQHRGVKRFEHNPEEIPQLHQAILKNEKVYQVENLLKDSIDIVNVRDKDNNTALHHAVDNRCCLDIIEVLIEYDANIYAKNSKGHCPLLMAVKDGQVEIVQLLLDGNERFHAALEILCELEKIDLAKQLVDRNLAERRGAYYIALQKGMTDIVARLQTEEKIYDTTFNKMVTRLGEERYEEERYEEERYEEERYEEERYEGEFRGSKKNGQGILTFPNGSQYKGEIIDDKMHGQGVYTWADGHRYEGEFRDGKRNGRGVYTWADSSRYEGEFSDDKMHGQGVYVWPDGRRYEGECRDGKLTTKVLTSAPQATLANDKVGAVAPNAGGGGGNNEEKYALIDDANPTGADSLSDLELLLSTITDFFLNSENTEKFKAVTAKMVEFYDELTGPGEFVGADAIMEKIDKELQKISTSSQSFLTTILSKLLSKFTHADDNFQYVALTDDIALESISEGTTEKLSYWVYDDELKDQSIQIKILQVWAGVESLFKDFITRKPSLAQPGTSSSHCRVEESKLLEPDGDGNAEDGYAYVQADKVKNLAQNGSHNAVLTSLKKLCSLEKEQEEEKAYHMDMGATFSGMTMPPAEWTWSHYRYSPEKTALYLQAAVKGFIQGHRYAELKKFLSKNTKCYGTAIQELARGDGHEKTLEELLEGSFAIQDPGRLAVYKCIGLAQGGHYKQLKIDLSKHQDNASIVCMYPKYAFYLAQHGSYDELMDFLGSVVEPFSKILRTLTLDKSFAKFQADLEQEAIAGLIVGKHNKLLERFKTGKWKIKGNLQTAWNCLHKKANDIKGRYHPSNRERPVDDNLYWVARRNPTKLPEVLDCFNTVDDQPKKMFAEWLVNVLVRSDVNNINPVRRSTLYYINRVYSKGSPNILPRIFDFILDNLELISEDVRICLKKCILAELDIQQIYNERIAERQFKIFIDAEVWEQRGLTLFCGKKIPKNIRAMREICNDNGDNDNGKADRFKDIKDVGTNAKADKPFFRGDMTAAFYDIVSESSSFTEIMNELHVSNDAGISELLPQPEDLVADLNDEVQQLHQM